MTSAFTTFARWNWHSGVGIEPLSPKKLARIRSKGGTFVAHFPGEHVVITSRAESKFAAIGFLDENNVLKGNVAFDVGPPTRLEYVHVYRSGRLQVSLQGGQGTKLSFQVAPFYIEDTIDPRPVQPLASVEDYEALLKLPRDPWAYVDVPKALRDRIRP